MTNEKHDKQNPSGEAEIEELLPVVDSSGKEIGHATRRECHARPGHLHPVVHLHVINSYGEIFLQKRSATKDIFPLKWDTAVGGHIAWGESPQNALMREACEEIGINGFTPEFIGTQCTHTIHESEFVYIYLTHYDGPFVLSPDELDDGRFWNFIEIDANLDSGFYTPNFEQDYPLLRLFLSQQLI